MRFYMKVMRELAVAFAGAQNRRASVRDENNSNNNNTTTNNNKKKEFTLKMSDYFDDEWVSLAYSKIVSKSLEEKVDHLWISILSLIFPRSSNFLVLQQCHLEGSGSIPDIVVKFFRNQKEYVVLVMENKRLGGNRKEGIDDLKGYLCVARSKDLFNENIPEYGLVGVGCDVKFYKRQPEEKEITDYDEELVFLNVKKDKALIHKRLVEIRDTVLTKA